MLSFITKIYKNQKKSYHLLLIILILISSFEFTFLAMYDAFTRFHFDWTIRSSLHGIPILASAVALLLNVFVTKYFIVNKKQEFAILLLSGRKPKDLFYYILLQFGILILIAYFIGGVFGIGLMYIINTLLSINQSSVILNYTITNVFYTSFFMSLFTFVIVLALAAQQFVRLDIDVAKYLSHKESLDKPSYIIKASAVSTKRKIPIFSILMTILFATISIYSLIQLLLPDLSTSELLMSFTLALSGIYVIVLTSIPLLYDLCHHKLLKHPILMNALSSFNEFTKTMMTLVSLNTIILPMMLILIFFSANHPVTQVVIAPCFLMIIIMIALCFIIRFYIYDQRRQSSIATYHAIGYSYQTMNKISFIKNILFTVFCFVIPFVFICELFYKSYLENYLSLSIILIMISAYLVINCNMLIYIYMKEKQTQWEVTNHVKYLNRGQ